MSLLLNEKIDDLSYHPWSFLRAPRVKKNKKENPQGFKTPEVSLQLNH